MTQLEFKPGDLVLSRCGRDAGRLFFILNAQGEMLTLCDGRMRRTENPKNKKQKHVCWVDRPESETADKLRAGSRVTNREIRRTLGAYMELPVDAAHGGAP